jgi:hypothetical protein
MANIELLISKLDRRLKSLHQEQSLVTKAHKIGDLEQGLLSEYIRLTTTGGIIPGVEFIVLDSLSKHFNLYEDDRERQQILSAMSGELNDATSSDLLASTKIIQNAYPSIYLLTQERLNVTTIHPVSWIVRILKEPEARSKLVIGMVIIGAAIFGAIISNTFNKSISSSSFTTDTTPQTPSILVPATSPPNPSSSQQNVTPTQAVAAQPTPSPEQTVTTQQVSTTQNNPVISEDRQSGLETLSYQSHCTLLSEQNKSENIIDDNCNISQTIDGKNYTLNWTNGEVSHVEIITDRQVIINGEQASIVQKNSNGITISFSKGRIGWDLK